MSKHNTSPQANKLTSPRNYPPTVPNGLDAAATNDSPQSIGREPEKWLARDGRDELQQPEPSTILFITENDYLRSTLRSFLDHAGFRVRCCADVSRAPDLFFRNPLVDLLLIDIDELGTIGVRLAASLTTFRHDLPVIVMSETLSEELAFSGRTWGNWKFVRKPVFLPDLLETIQLKLNHSGETPDFEATSPGESPTTPRRKLQ